MKLEHLMQAYKINEIEAELKEETEATDINGNKERAGVISFGNGISASYLLDDEEIVVAMKIFFNCLARNSFKVDAQISHAIKVITVMQNTIMLLSNIPQKECNMILQSLEIISDFSKFLLIGMLKWEEYVLYSLMVLCVNSMNYQDLTTKKNYKRYIGILSL